MLRFTVEISDLKEKRFERKETTDASRLFGLEVSVKKTEVLHQPTPHEECRPPHISTGDTELKSTQQFTYLGCTFSSDAKIDKEIDNRLAKANSSFGRLHKLVWNNKCLKCKTKNRVYRAVVLTTPLFSSEPHPPPRAFPPALLAHHF